jgi:hypothetical protein
VVANVPDVLVSRDSSEPQRTQRADGHDDVRDRLISLIRQHLITGVISEGDRLPALVRQLADSILRDRVWLGVIRLYAAGTKLRAGIPRDLWYLIRSCSWFTRLRFVRLRPCFVSSTLESHGANPAVVTTGIVSWKTDAIAIRLRLFPGESWKTAVASFVDDPLNMSSLEGFRLLAKLLRTAETTDFGVQSNQTIVVMILERHKLVLESPAHDSASCQPSHKAAESKTSHTPSRSRACIDVIEVHPLHVRS